MQLVICGREGVIKRQFVKSETGEGRVVAKQGVGTRILIYMHVCARACQTQQKD